MKPGESFQLTETWWKAGKPTLLTDTGLGGALRKFLEADQKFQSAKKLENYSGVVKALDNVNTVRQSTIGKCGSNPLFKTTKEALEKSGVIAQRKTVLKLAVTAVVDEEVKKLESKLTDENKIAGRFAEAEKILSAKIAQFKKAGNNEALKLIGKELGRQATNVMLSKDSSVVEEARHVLAKLGPYATEFTAEFERIKKVVAKSAENAKVANALTNLANENSDITADD